MAIEFEYADAPLGRLHLRRYGAGLPVVLLHWAPASGRMYEAAMPFLAEAGYEAIAMDLPGYGRSHKGVVKWPIERYAKNVFQAIESVIEDGFYLVGGHLSASIATEIALVSQNRVCGLVLDGILNLTSGEWQHLLRRFEGLSPHIKQDSSYRSFPFEMVCRTLEEWNPDFQLDDSTLPQVYSLLNDYLEMGLEAINEFVEPSPDNPIGDYDIASALSSLRVPTLVLTADREPLAPAFSRSVAAIPDAKGHRFQGVHPLLSGLESEYARTIVEFFGRA